MFGCQEIIVANIIKDICFTANFPISLSPRVTYYFSWKERFIMCLPPILVICLVVLFQNDMILIRIWCVWSTSSFTIYRDTAKSINDWMTPVKNHNTMIYAYRTYKNRQRYNAQQKYVVPTLHITNHMLHQLRKKLKDLIVKWWKKSFLYLESIQELKRGGR